MTNTQAAIDRYNRPLFWAAILVLAAWNFAPVVVAMKPIDPLEYKRPYVIGEFVGFKLKKCRPVVNSERGLVQIGGVWHEDVAFIFVDDPSPGSSKPARAKSYFGVWEWEYGVRPDKVMMKMHHICGGRQVTSTYGPYEVIK